MNTEPNQRDPFAGPLEQGDFVAVHLNADIVAGHIGFIIEADATFIRLQAHQPNGKEESPHCLNVEVVYPVSSVAWVIHRPVKPSGCTCEGYAS